MKWADLVLRALLKPRDRDTVSGDLLEEYHHRVLASSSPWPARAWYARQVLSFVTALSWGLLIGAAAGAWMLIDTALHPLADDEGAVMILYMAGLLLLWAAVGF